MGRRTCAAAASTSGWARPSPGCPCATAGSRRRPSAARAVTADYYVAALPVEVMRTLLSPELRARRAAAERARPARHALDERDPVLPRRGPAAGPRPRHLPRLRVGADVDLPAAVLEVVRLPGDRRHPVARHLRVAARGAPDREGRGDVHAGGDPHGGLGAVAGPPRAARSTASRSARGSSTRRSSSRTRRARRTPSRCSSTPRARGPTGRTPRLRIPNLVLAADYVRTHTDLATMEGANEAARRAVNAILDADALVRAALRRVEAARAAGARAGAHVRPRAVAVAAAAADAGAGVGVGRGARRRRARTIADVTRAVRA